MFATGCRGQARERSAEKAQWHGANLRMERTKVLTAFALDIIYPAQLTSSFANTLLKLQPHPIKRPTSSLSVA